jgi:glycosyltransferase involved in cell wall biosynthesis
MGVGDPVASPAAAARVRARHGLPASSLVVAAFGAVTPEKRIEPVVRALAVARAYAPDVRLLLVGQTLPHFDAGAVARRHGVSDRVVMSGFVAGEDLPAYLAASDLVVSLRWPSARETSASWLRAIAAGRPTIVTALAQQAAVPMLDPRSWAVVHGLPTLAPVEPVAVGIDVLDEQHSLNLAVKRLATDSGLRARLAAAARAHWSAGHRLGHMADGYDAAMEAASRQPDPVADLPAHLRPEAAAHARALVNRFRGVHVFGS